ncbi:MAG: radical SAM protein [Candidatus Omnitrophica bacterium]|nr:radical SAM protein [Candidatus Omnitrophota bacterium]
MKEIRFSDFSKSLQGLKQRAPLYGQIELTSRCLCRCVHCYCANEPRKELSPAFWKDILDQVSRLGGLEVTFTGGDALLYPGFLEVYRHAKAKGFLVHLFTSAVRMDPKILRALTKEPPFSIEVTLNSLDDANYDRITGTRGLLDAVLKNIREMKKRGLPLVLKCNGLKENKDEILKIKKFTEELLGKGKFKFDSFIFPRLDQGKGPTSHRLSPEEIETIESGDADMIAQREEQRGHQPSWFNPDGLYHCNTWMTRYYINPQGLLQFCHLTQDCSTDLTKEPFKKGFDRFVDVLKVKYKTKSKCRDCEFRAVCYTCPARAFLETGDPEAPVEYYCELARAKGYSKNRLDP